MLDREQMSTAIVVTGLPRSGTSAVAGILHRLDVPLGKHFTEADDTNKKGFYEDIRFANINALMTRTANFTDWMVAIDKVANEGAMFNIVDMPRQISTYAYVGLIMAQCTKYQVWGVKDPRFILPYVLEDFLKSTLSIVRVGVIHVQRDLDSVYNSLLSVSTMSSDVKERTRANLKVVRDGFKERLIEIDLPVLEINYDNILYDSTGETEAIASFVYADIPEPDKIEEAASFIDKNLRRY